MGFTDDRGVFQEGTVLAAAISLDLRTRVMHDLERGMSARAAAVKYSISVRAIYFWKVLKRETGGIKPRRGKTGPKPKLEPHREAITAGIRKTPGVTLAELRSQLQLPGCVQTLWNALQRWGIVLKKSHPSRRTTTA